MTNDAFETKEVAAVVDNYDKVTVTLKGGKGFEAPWIVIHANSTQEALDILNEESMKELNDRVHDVATYFNRVETVSSNGKPASASQPPAGAPACPPGWTFKSGVSKSGKPYKGYFPPQGSNEKPIWF